MLLKRPLAQEIRLGSPDRFSSWEGGVWGRDYYPPFIMYTQLWCNCLQESKIIFGFELVIGNIAFCESICAIYWSELHNGSYGQDFFSRAIVLWSRCMIGPENACPSAFIVGLMLLCMTKSVKYIIYGHTIHVCGQFLGRWLPLVSVEEIYTRQLPRLPRY